MPSELFRTNIVTRDPRYPSIISICNYSLAGLFLGMFLTLSGVMLTASADQEAEQDGKFAHIFGLTMLISGCLLILIAIASFLVASVMYLKTTTTPPTTEESGEASSSVWSYLDNLPEKSPTTKESGSTEATN